MTIKAILFDKDGVLVNSEKLKATAWSKTLKNYGINNKPDWYFSNLGLTSIDLASIAIQDYNLEAFANDISKQWKSHYQSLEHYVEPIVENIQTLIELSRDYRIAVVSSMARHVIEKEMDRFECLQYIQHCVSGKDVKKNKPAPDVYSRAVNVLDLSPKECVAIEDSSAGIQAAKSAGIYCIGYISTLYSIDLSKADEITSNISYSYIKSFTRNL